MSKDREFDKRKKFMMELLGDPVYQPMRFREIAGLLRLSKDEKKDLYRVLDDLVAEGKADLDSKGRYSCLLYTSNPGDPGSRKSE